MKKIYSLVSTMLATASLYAQFTTIDFENLVLPAADTFYVGADGAGGFSSEGVLFKNSYEEFSWGYSWGGFAYSNMTDATTPGFGNQFSAIPGEGANNSEKYAIYTNSDTLIFPYSAVFGDVKITNTTYAYYAVKDGDDGNTVPFVKGPFEEGDFFMVTLYGWDMNVNLVDSVEVYLADYLSTDANDHYVLDTWTSFNLSALDGSKYVTFKIQSSDVGPWGMNTPAYFALDDLEFNLMVNSIAENTPLEVAVFPNPTVDILHIKSDEKLEVTVYSAAGRVIQTKSISGSGSIDLSSQESGVYFLRLQGTSGQSVQRVIKQ